MARNYDEWNFMGESLDTSSQRDFESKISSLKTIFLISSIVLVVLGLVCLYSASYPGAVSKNLPQYYYFFRQLIFLLGGLAFSSLVYFQRRSLFSVFICLGLILSICGIIFLPEKSFGILMITMVIYFSHYFANRNNKIGKLRTVFLPLGFYIFFGVLVVLKYDISYLLIYISIMITLFAICGVGIGGVVLLFLFSVVPAVCLLFGSTERVQTIMVRLMPGLVANETGIKNIYSFHSLLSGGLFGKGLGNGTLKYDSSLNIIGCNIICNVMEEFGLIGLIVIFILFGILAYSGYRCSLYARKYNLHCANLSSGMTTILVWHFILNIASIFGLLPFNSISLPFFSYGEGITIAVIECAFILYSMKNSVLNRDNSESDIVSLENN